MAKLVVLYGTGGLSDVGRHAILAALEQGGAVESIKVLTRFPELLKEPSWNCGCEAPHEFPTHDSVDIVSVESWNPQDIQPHIKDATGFISCLGNRQPAQKASHYESEEGNKALLAALPAEKKHRVVVISSVGIEEDWPPLESPPFKDVWYAGRIMSFLFFMPGLCRGAFNDLTAMEKAYRATEPDNVDFLLARPVGLGEEVVPSGKWWLQKEKYKDKVGVNVAKMDVARFMVQECLKPTRHREAVVIGSDPDTPM